MFEDEETRALTYFPASDWMLTGINTFLKNSVTRMFLMSVKQIGILKLYFFLKYHVQLNMFEHL